MGKTMRVQTQRTLTVGDSWTSLASCRGTESSAFFARSLPEAREAIRVCERCPVRQQCLDYAVDNDMDLGVWGGLTERQRRTYVRRNRR
jgi:WhiB family redox-sensing transcriptional regulator